MDIDDDADPATLNAWYNRTPDQIADGKARAWNAAWSALRMPDELAYETQETPPTGQIVDAAAIIGPDECPVVGKRPGYTTPEKKAWASQDLAFLDVLSGGEAPGYDVLATQPGHPLRHFPKLTNGQPDYSQHPNDLLEYSTKSGKVVRTTAAGRYQINKPTWDAIVADHADIGDIHPVSQDKAAWYGASDLYTRQTGRDLSSDLLNEHCWPLITSTLKGRWPSLPGGSQQQQTQEQFNDGLRQGNEKYRDPRPD